MSAISTSLLRELAPTGRLRVAINLGNSVLAQRDAAGTLGGVSVELARALAERLGLAADFATFDAAGKVFEAVKRGEIDVMFLAVDPLRAEEIAFTQAYVLIEGNFVVPADSAVKSMGDIDRPGVRVAAARGSAYALYLARALKAATLVHFSTGDEALNAFVRDKLEAAAGVRQPVAAFVRAHQNLRLVEPPFMQIRQAMGTLKPRAEGAAYLRGFIEEMKASGFVADALRRSGQGDVSVAPAAAPESPI